MEFLELLAHIGIRSGAPYLLFAVTCYFSYNALRAATASLLFNDLKKRYTEELIKNTTELYNQFNFNETEKR